MTLGHFGQCNKIYCNLRSHKVLSNLYEYQDKSWRSVYISFQTTILNSTTAKFLVGVFWVFWDLLLFWGIFLSLFFFAFPFAFQVLFTSTLSLSWVTLFLYERQDKVLEAVVQGQVASDNGWLVILSRPSGSRGDEPGFEAIRGRNHKRRTLNTQLSSGGTSAGKFVVSAGPYRHYEKQRVGEFALTFRISSR